MSKKINLNVDINDMFMKVLEQSELDPNTKYHLQQILENDFDGDWKELLKDTLQLAVEEEKYELAAEIRNYLNK